MRYLYGVLFLLTFSLLPSASEAYTSNDFVTTWDTTNTRFGGSNNNQILIPFGGGGNTNFTIDWGDGAAETYTNDPSTLLHTYATSGVKTVAISSNVRGGFTSFQLSNDYYEPEIYKLLTVEQWGNIVWTSEMHDAFAAPNLTIPATDVPNLSGVISMSNMFQGAESLNSDLSAWDVSNVQNFYGMFDGATSFNQPLNSWDLSSATNLSAMFTVATSFNQPLNSWDVSGVTYMQSMFSSATSFNQPLDMWNTSAVTSMNSMFENAVVFNQSLNSWDVSQVSLMQHMFERVTVFNQPLDMWNTSAVLNMNRMFNGATSFNQPLNNWNVSHVVLMPEMFKDAIAFNQPLNNWDLSGMVYNAELDYGGEMQYMFYRASSFNHSLGEWHIPSGAWLEGILEDSGINSQNYAATLIGWGALNMVPTVGQENIGIVPTSYCNTAQAARNILTNTYNWTISDGGPVSCFSLSYTAGTNASLIGSGSQAVESGEDGTSVTVVPDAGYRFVKWSDENTANPRTDTAVLGNLVVTAILETDTSGTQTGSKRKQPEATTTTATTISSVQLDILAARLQDLLVYIQDNQASIAALSPEEKQRFATLLQSIVAFLLIVLGQVQ